MYKGRGKGNFEEWKVLFSRKWLKVENLLLSWAYKLAVCGLVITVYTACGLKVSCSEMFVLENVGM